MNTTTKTGAASIEIPSAPAAKARTCGDDEAACVICNKPVKLTDRTWMLWVHGGGSIAVTQAEGERLNATGEQGGDLGAQPIGSDCLRWNPELKPFAGRGA